MPALRVHGPVRLAGTVRVAGAKNAALPMMAAAILAEGPLRLRGVPDLADVAILTDLLQRLGVSVQRQDTDLLLEARDTANTTADYDLVRQMRASICVLGPLLASRGRAEVALPGGCALGDRPIDLHLKGLAALGARFEVRHGYVVGQADRLHGATIDLAGPRGPTVTGTANVLCAAARAEGRTLVHHAAREPEIVDLGRLLIGMGAKIDGLGTETLQIEGVPALHGADHRIIPDRIEAATLLLAGAISQGAVRLEGVEPAHLSAVLAALRGAGATIEATADAVELRMNDRPKAMTLLTEPYPGLPSDLQAQWMAYLTTANGESRVRDTVFPQRFLHAAELNRLGADIRLADGAAIVPGRRQLSGAVVRATDLRAGAAMVLAGLAAEGVTVIEEAQHIDRGYERLDKKLAALGARIERVDTAS